MLLDDKANLSYAYQLSAAKCNFANDALCNDDYIKDNLDRLPLKPVVVNGQCKRYAGWFTDFGCTCNYSYGSGSHEQWQAFSYSPFIRQLYDTICSRANIPLDTCNCVFVSCYESEAHFCPWHSDDERIFEAQDVPIISWSYGAARKFGIRGKIGSEDFYKTTWIESGDVVTMGGAMQRHYEHTIFPSKSSRQTSASSSNPIGKRWNFTFRNAVNHSPDCQRHQSPFVEDN